MTFAPIRIHLQRFADPELTCCGRKWMLSTFRSDCHIVILQCVEELEKVTCSHCIKCAGRASRGWEARVRSRRAVVTTEAFDQGASMMKEIEK